MSKLDLKQARVNLAIPRLYEEIIKNREGKLSEAGAMVVRPGDSRPLPPKDRYLVHTGSGEPGAREISAAQFDKLYQRLLAYLQSRMVYVQDRVIGRYICPS